MTKTTTLTAIVCIVFVACRVFAQGSLTPPGAPAETMKTLEQVEPRWPISSVPTNLTRSGSYYLTTNLTAGAGQNGITVSTNNVTIDLNGFTLSGSGTDSGWGIYQSSTYKNLRVHNGKVLSWAKGTRGGIRIEGNNGQVEGVKVTKNYWGMSVGYGGMIVNCSAYDNDSYGIAGGLSSSISDCSSFYNANGGIAVYDGSTVANCVAYSNAANGIEATIGATIRDCTAKFNGSDNIEVDSYCFVENNHCTGSINGAGIYVKASPEIDIEGEYCRIDSNTVVDNQIGIHVEGKNNLVVRNSAGGNGTNYEIAASNKVGKIISPPDCAAISGDTGGGFGATAADATARPWVNFVTDAQ